MKNSILLMFHCKQNTGYAISNLEKIFYGAALQAGYHSNNVLWSFSEIDKPKDNIFRLHYQSDKDGEKLTQLVQKHNINTIIAFDMPIPCVLGGYARKAGVSNLVAYWGASISTINSGFKLLIKKIEWYLRRSNAPHVFIFESVAMQRTAVQGRGIPKRNTAVVPLGVDTERFKPHQQSNYIHKQLKIPINRKIVFYSGHMEERKGIRTLVLAAKYLANLNKIQNIHFVLCGNKGNEADTYLDELQNSTALGHVTFAGYRDDIPYLMSSSDIGAIVSTGWDSFTMSSVEILASGLPLIVSNLGGLPETTVHGKTGLVVEPGDQISLGEVIYNLLNDSETLVKYSKEARKRAIDYFSKKKQINSIAKFLKC